MGSLASGMLLHIILMNLVAPLLAGFAVAVSGRWRQWAPRRLLAATILQLALLWGWHAPAVLSLSGRSHLLHLAMQASLLGAAFLFWSAVLGFRSEQRWKPILALLATSKLFCLLAVLFVFSPRLLYAASAAVSAHHGAGAPAAGLEDQQLAGLMMLLACPLTFVLAGIFLAGRWIFDMERMDASPASAARARV